MRKEWLDFFRDRRTFLLSLMVAPLLYPLIFLGIGKLTQMRAETQLEKTLSVPVVECHLSNPAAREDFRRHSYVSLVATGVISGFGPHSYELAVKAALRLARERAAAGARSPKI